MAIVRATAMAGCEPAHKRPSECPIESNLGLVKACLLRADELSKRGHETALLLARELCDQCFMVDVCKRRRNVSNYDDAFSRETGRRPKGSIASVWPVPATFAVGTRVTSRPPHRSVRAQFGHTAPTSGV